MLSTAALIVLVDQLTKSLIVARLEEGASTSASVLGMRFRHVVNRGKPWGSRVAVRVLAIAWLFLFAGAYYAASNFSVSSVHIALGALLGGATGNLVDGISRNGVTDFIDLRVWPVFNVADAAIVAGAIMLLFDVVRLATG